ncbi:head GIN domain-containing protein [Flavobacterium sp. 38-13]|uniref:head GIN domain-containing protein n=1 Tax=Flavobacterium sp. 38-13 TaxID=1896168 RepID=UPI000B1C25BE|nr:head GIN domain-containing protein [Flavobacterium sp. 38-13]
MDRSMMKAKITTRIIVLFSIAFLSCDSENANDCFQTSGTPITREFVVNDFKKINIGEGIELIIKQGPEKKVVVKTGENLLGGITAEVQNEELFLRNSNGCNWVRDYNTTQVYVTTPTLINVYSSSQFGVKSDGVLGFPSLSLQSGMFSDTASGTFEVEVNCNQLTIEDNKDSYFAVSGTTQALYIGFYNGNARFDGSDLTAKEVHVFHRSSNDIIVRPTDKISGTIYSTGNVVLKNVPPVIEVTQLYQGRLVYP